MKFPEKHTLKQIANLLNCKYIGEDDFPVLGMNEIHVVTPGDIVFVDHPKYYDKALKSAATVVLINKEVDCPIGKALLISNDPFSDFNKLTNYFKPFQSSNQAISDTAKIGKNTIIQPNCFIGNNVVIGDNCIIHSNVSIYDDTIIGNNVVIHAGTVLGSSAFYYKNRPEGFDQLISGGRVVIENNVTLGALCTIDRGVTGDTTIKEGTKIDSQVHIGHDTVVGKKCLIAAQTAIAGCVIVKDEVTIWAQVAIINGLVIAKGTEIYGQSGVVNSTKENKTYYGTPAMEAREKLREIAYLKKLPEIIKKVNEPIY